MRRGYCKRRNARRAEKRRIARVVEVLDRRPDLLATASDKVFKIWWENTNG